MQKTNWPNLKGPGRHKELVGGLEAELEAGLFVVLVLVVLFGLGGTDLQVIGFTAPPPRD